MANTRPSAIASSHQQCAGSHLRERVRSLSVAAVCKVGAVVLLSAALSACGDRAVNLYSGLSESEANRLVAYLDGQGVKTHKVAERDGLSVTVASSQLAHASQLSTQAGLPRTEYKGFGAVFPKDGLISSPLEERARLTYATSQELEAMLADIDGVLGARVNVVIPERRNGRNTDLPAAAVLIRHRADMETDLLEMKVRRLVAASVPGLVDADSRQISVSFMPVQTARLGATAANLESGTASSVQAPAQARAQTTVLPVIAAGYALSPGEAVLMSGSAIAGLSGKNSTRATTMVGIVLGVIAALTVIAWALRHQFAAMFRSKRPPAAPAA